MKPGQPPGTGDVRSLQAGKFSEMEQRIVEICGIGISLESLNNGLNNINNYIKLKLISVK